MWISVNNPTDMAAVSSAAMSTPPRLQAVVFDMDGTLIDSSWVVPAAFIATITELGGPTLKRDEVIASYVIGTPAAIMERFLGRPIDPSEIDGYHARLRAETALRGVHPYPGIVGTLEALAGSVALGMFTNADLGNVDVLLEASPRGIDLTEVRAHMTALEGVKDVHDLHAWTITSGLLACERLGVTAASTAYVGDSPQDGETAHHAGSVAVAARWGHPMRDVSAFDLAVDRPMDLPDALGLT